MAESADDLAKFMAQWLTETLGHEVKPDAAFAALGLDSFDAVRLTDAVAEKLGLDELPVSIILDHITVTSLATHLATMKSP